jgi:hypothetical protein
MLKKWIIRPIVRGLFFGAGHYVALRIVGPFFCDTFGLQWFPYKTAAIELTPTK